MGVYIGYIQKKNYDYASTFYNFKPIAEIHNGSVMPLNQREIDELLPESELRNINFSYDWHDQTVVKQMEKMFVDNGLFVFEFETDDLQDNLNSYGERNRTGYKVQVLDLVASGIIRRIEAEGLYHILTDENLQSDFYTDAVVDIAAPCLTADEQVVVQMSGFFAGPYEVGYRELTASLYIRPQIKENLYTYKGYSAGAGITVDLSSDPHWDDETVSWRLFKPKKDAIQEQRDTISIDTLIEGFKDSIDNSLASDGRVSLDDIPALISRYESSVLSSGILSDAIKEARLNKLKEIIVSEKDIDTLLGTISDYVVGLLIKYKDDPSVDSWVTNLLQQHPEIVEQLKDTPAISSRIAQMQESLGELVRQRDEVEKEIEERKKTAESVKQAAIEAKKAELLEMDEEYAASSWRLEELKRMLDLGESIEALNNQQKSLKEETDYLEQHKTRLKDDTTRLEGQFLTLISNQHTKMLDIAFDGFMSSKMLHAAAEWEAEQTDKEHHALVEKVNSVAATDMDSDQLIDYLCKTIQIVRPKYSRNTILNIAICTTQGFLTVFSGDPGSGKTSICNIFADVLGLHKVADQLSIPSESKVLVERYVQVSVERGWTSKRDFIGYYNPLSKSFDKSNRRVYDALHLLDSEKKSGFNTFPYVILLDEANLSPMEYYWSDFMNVCDDLGEYSSVNLGEDHIFGIPETLRFVATINNDHTTETLSPRLIDRAWIISLPQQLGAATTNKHIMNDQIRIIGWPLMQATFMPKQEDNRITSPEAQRAYELILSHLRKNRVTVSPRINEAIKRYWVVASKLFEADDAKTSPDIVALDYAIAQRILPKIGGNGEQYEVWLEELRSLCSSNGLNMSAETIKEIILRGNQQMKYYQFFN